VVVPFVCFNGQGEGKRGRKEERKEGREEGRETFEEGREERRVEKREEVRRKVLVESKLSLASPKYLLRNTQSEILIQSEREIQIQPVSLFRIGQVM
jgi:hypothetical protein